MEKWITESALEGYPEAQDREIREALHSAVQQVERNLADFTDSFPGANSVNGRYRPGENRGWTTGFWTGEIWLAYEAEAEVKKKAALLHAGERQVVSFLRRIETRYDVDHHDMGFLYSPSCVAAYKLIGSETGKRAALLAAEQLLRRFQPVGGFLQAWGTMGEAGNYRFIIDCLLNLPLLYWASEETGETRFREIAERHIRTAMANVIREDGSAWHTVFMNPESGAFDHGATCQGYRDGSAWARGQAWGIYGTAMAYRYTKREEYIRYFQRVTSYFLNHLPKDLIPCWDLSFGEGDIEPLREDRFGDTDYDAQVQPRDSSSALIVICGLLEMSGHLGGTESVHYRSIARKLLEGVLRHCITEQREIGSGLVLHGTYSHKSPYNTCTPEGTNEYVIWGDYYYMEALTRLLRPEWRIYW